jgi:glycosyltransferase involved in cell wall biosynthesis
MTYRILHATYLQERSTGIYAQLIAEKRAAFETGIPLETWVYIKPEEGHVIELFRRIVRSDYLKYQVMRIVRFVSIRVHLLYYFHKLFHKSKCYDIVLIRYIPGSFLLLLFLIFRGRKTYTVHHTIESREIIANKSVKGYLSLLKEESIGRLAVSLTRGVISVTDEILEYQRSRFFFNQQRPCLVYPNGITYTEVEPLDSRVSHSPPRLVTIASKFYDWVGLDIILEKLKSQSRPFSLDVVGECSEYLIAAAESMPTVTLHGPLGGDQLKVLLSSADLGLDCFALERKGMRQGCALKVREYLLAGVPVYGPYCDVFPKDFTFYRSFEIDMSRALDFALEMRSVPRKEVSGRAKKYISKVQLLRNLYDSIL